MLIYAVVLILVMLATNSEKAKYFKEKIKNKLSEKKAARKAKKAQKTALASDKGGSENG